MSPRVCASPGRPRPVGQSRRCNLRSSRENVAHARQLLPETAKQAAQVSLLAVGFQRGFEELRTRASGGGLVAQAFGQPCVDSFHILVDDLEGEVLFVREVVVEGALGDARRSSSAWIPRSW